MMSVDNKKYDDRIRNELEEREYRKGKCYIFLFKIQCEFLYLITLIDSHTVYVHTEVKSSTIKVSYNHRFER